VNDLDWGTVVSLAGLFVIGCGYLARRMNRLDDKVDRLEDRLSRHIDQLTERYITNLQHHSR
jgi:hypothetical protein